MYKLFNKFDRQRNIEDLHLNHLSEVDLNIIHRWNQTYENSKKKRIRSIKTHNNKFTLIDEEFMTIVEKQMRNVSTHFVISHLFILTDSNGKVLKMVGFKEVLHAIQSLNISEGISSYSLEESGINGITAAIQLEKPIVVVGKENHMEAYHESICLCSPIKHSSKISGYIGLFLHIDEDICFASVILNTLIEEIERELISTDVHKRMICEQFNLYKLTKREKEVAFCWLQNSSVKQISETLFITQGTIRNHIKNVYRKTDTNRKGEFIVKFLIEKL